uniref:Uncharacterized protein n=1 Tax=Opuntia streptacantha TaxID=393608 RepID=A0A7C9DWY3_OPUST
MVFHNGLGMSPADQAARWKAGAMMLYPVSCHNSYFVRGDRWTCYDAISRATTPRFPLFIPVLDKHYGVTRTSVYNKRLRTYIHGSVMQEQYVPVHSSAFALSKAV